MFRRYFFLGDESQVKIAT